MPARIVQHTAHDDGQYVLRMHAPDIAATAQPGQFLHLQCHAELAMRRPLSIMHADPNRGHVDVLYKILGYGTQLLAQQAPGNMLWVMGPIGRPFELREQIRPLLIGGGVGIPPLVFLAQHIKQTSLKSASIAFFGSEITFPFRALPSQFLVPHIGAHVTAAMPLLEDWGIPSRLSSRKNYPGCFDGYVTALAEQWIAGLSRQEVRELHIYACGPTPMLEAVAALAATYQIPAQVCVEEFMACAVGGCAGCTVKIQTPTGPAMQRVCVDGPVFDAAQWAVYNAAR